MGATRDIVLFDLDGTLADIKHRLHLIECDKPDWPSFYRSCVSDTVIEHMQMIWDLFERDQKYKLWIVSGRSDEVRGYTVDWLLHHAFRWDRLIMRPAGDYTKDCDLKLRWLQDGTIPKDRVICVFEDRSQVVNMWREQGLNCLQVAEGNF